jgi:hypothetical protein
MLVVGWIKKLVRALKPLRTVTIDVNGHELTAAPAINADIQEILDKISARTGHQKWHESRGSSRGLRDGHRHAAVAVSFGLSSLKKQTINCREHPYTCAPLHH